MSIPRSGSNKQSVFEFCEHFTVRSDKYFSSILHHYEMGSFGLDCLGKISSDIHINLVHCFALEYRSKMN